MVQHGLAMHRIQNYNRLYNLSRPFSFSVVSLVTSGPNTCPVDRCAGGFDWWKSQLEDTDSVLAGRCGQTSNKVAKVAKESQNRR